VSQQSNVNKRIQSAQEVIRTEQAGLEALCEIIDEEFSNAVELVLKTEDYLIVVGVGKSGHIGQKIAASFASTGTRSFFMHPTEASHGDLGMVSPNSTLFIISNSGESRELRDVLNYARKMDIKIIGVTKNPDSTLGTQANHVLRLPHSPEACPNGLAPTTSTTNTLALADALVVAVMSERGFTKEEFGQMHPGGKLGLQLQSVEDWLSIRSRDVPTVSQNSEMRQTVMAMTESRMGCVAVVDGKDRFVGMITDGDLRRALSKDIFDKSAADIMTADPISLTRDMSIRQVIELFTERRIANAFVVDAGKAIGLIDMKTLLEDGYI